MSKIIISFYKLFLFLLLFNFTKAMDGHLFLSPVANILEPRIGAIFELSVKKLRLDIGTSVDLLEFKTGENSIMRIGTDFFTLSRLRSEGNMKFPVETADYFFGINSTAKGIVFGYDYSARLRLAHISSHIVDGMANDTILKVEPFVYSREFAELIGAVNINDIRFYAGLTYVFSRQPKITNSLIPQLGFDSRIKINNFMDFCIGYDLRLTGLDNTYSALHSFVAGTDILITGDTCIRLFLSVVEGKSIHGMFYKNNESFKGIGFQVVY
ncbi:MAG: DUF1207 domain-containing protein [Bacteroidetes bacterium]|nr:MAG: DUF1207 domain-containing protein [Bacteroidota bacterium]